MNELSDENDLNVSQQDRSLPVSTQSYTIPHISHSTQAATHTTTQQSTNRQSYRVPHYYTDSYSSSDTRRVRRHKTLIITKKENIQEKMIENKTP